MLDVIDYDVILEMDFLSKYEAMINCKAEIVSLKTPGDEMFAFFDFGWNSRKMFILAMQAKEWLTDGCIAI